MTISRRKVPVRYFTPGANVSERGALPPPVAVSTVIFALREETLSLPLVKRIKEPYGGLWALPGGPVTWDESLLHIAYRTLYDTTGLQPQYLEQLYTFGEPGRSIAQRVISIVYWAQLNDAQASASAENVHWFPVRSLPHMAFDHEEIIRYALRRLQAKVELAAGFLPETFTLAQLRHVYEEILGHALDVANFRRQVLKDGHVIETGEVMAGKAHRPAKLYRAVE